MLLLTLCALPVASPSRETPDPSAKRLHFDLMSPYNALVKPSGGPKHQLTVKMGLRLSQVLNVVSILSGVSLGSGGGGGGEGGGGEPKDYDEMPFNLPPPPLPLALSLIHISEPTRPP